MLKSMTGYGSAKDTVNGLTLTVELRSVNNRHLDCSVRLPRGLMFAEETVQKTVAAAVSRGKVDVFVTQDAALADHLTVAVNRPLAERYIAALRSLSAEYGLQDDLTAVTLARFPDLLTVEKSEIDRDAAAEALREVAIEAISEFDTMRLREGERLREDMLMKLTEIERLVSSVEERSPETIAEYRARLEQKLRELLENAAADESRILTEVAIFADKIAVDEETVRLRSHISQFRALLEAGSPVGRKLDFLLQEFNREANTIGSKCSDAALALVVVELKSEIEKLREQAQNIE
jgi:uncharacterized protein (TIGR00255 family)